MAALLLRLAGCLMTTTPVADPAPTGQIALVDLLDRLLGAGVVVAGDVVISLAGVDLVRIQLQALITSVRSELRAEESIHVS